MALTKIGEILDPTGKLEAEVFQEPAGLVVVLYRDEYACLEDMVESLAPRFSFREVEGA